jgi:hypothetical protein
LETCVGGELAAARGQAQRRCQDMAARIAFSLKQESGSRPASSCITMSNAPAPCRPQALTETGDASETWSSVYTTKPFRTRTHLPDLAVAECRRRCFVPALPSGALGWSNSLPRPMHRNESPLPAKSLPRNSLAKQRRQVLPVALAVSLVWIR